MSSAQQSKTGLERIVRERTSSMSQVISTHCLSLVSACGRQPGQRQNTYIVNGHLVCKFDSPAGYTCESTSSVRFI